MTTFHCPECNARLRGGEPGTVVACHACANPVAVPAEPDAPRPLEELEAPVRRVRGPDSPWLTAALVLAIIAVAHVGLYVLLTLEASASRGDLEEQYGGRRALETAVEPEAEGPSPWTQADLYREWRRSGDLWSASKDYKSHGDHVRLLRMAFLFSFLVQVGITGWILMRILGQRRRARAAAQRAAA